MTQNESSPPKRGRWLKWLLGIVGGLLVLMVALYFVVTSGAFFKGVILPKVGGALNAEVTVSDAEIHPFSSIVLRDLKVTTKGSEPIFAASSVTARYNLRAILGGNIVVDEVAVVAPTVTVIERADGTSNLPQPAPAEKSKPEEKPAPAGKSTPPALDIKLVRIENATVRYVNPTEHVELTQVNFTATGIKNGATSKLTFSAALAARKPNSELQAKADATFTLAFDKNMQPTVVTGTKTLDIAKATGEFAALAKLGVKFDVEATLDHAAQIATVKTLRLNGAQGSRPLLQMDLSEPMAIVWGDRREKVPDATLNFTVTSLNLTDWKSLAGDSLPGGIASLKLKVVSAQAGQQLTFDLDARVLDLATAGVPALDVALKANGRVENLQKFDLSDYRLDVTQQKQSVLTMSGTGKFDKQTQSADAQMTIKTPLNRLATVLAQTNFACRTGQLELTSHVTSTPQTQTVAGKLMLTDFTGHYDEYRFDNFGATFDLDVATTGKQVDIRKFAGQLRPGGKLDVSGKFDGEKKAGQFAVKLVGFHADDLRPFLQPSLGENKLISISLDTTAMTEFDASGAASVKADLQVKNLIVQDPASRTPAPTLEATLKLDAAAKKSVLTLTQCELALTPTKRANNELRLTGVVDYAKSNAITGNLKLAANALDLTAYYDLFAATNESKQSSAPPAAPAARTNVVVEAKEPDPVTLPLRDFTFALAIDRLYLRELDIANFQMTTKIDGGHIVVKPLQLTLNSGPINSVLDLDLGVSGYKYDILFTTDKVPLGPLADSFSPSYRDSANGNLSGKIEIKGAGTTGRSLKKSLTGTTTLAVNNANIKLVGRYSKMIFGAISTALGAPEVMTSPLNYTDCNLRFGGGKIELEKFTARSDAMLVDVRGTIPMEDVLDESKINHIPVGLSLSRKLATRFHPNTPAEEGYAKWPTLVWLEGTLGAPDYSTVAGQAFSATTNALSKTTSAVKGAFGKVFGSSDTNATSSTTSTNKSLNPLNLFKRSKEE